MISTDLSKKIIKVLFPIFIAVLSFCILSKVVPESSIVNTSMERLEENEKVVERFTIAAISTSVAISFLPDDIGSSIADSLAEMNKYFVAILVAIYVEKLILTFGTAAAFKYIIPLACILYLLSIFIKKKFISDLAIKVAVLALAVVFIIPCGTKISDVVCANYMEYVNEIIEETENKSKTVTEIITTVDEEQSILDKISDAFKSAVTSVNDMISYFKGVIKKCITAIAILIVSTCIIPLLTIVLFIWIIKQLFNISWNPTPVVKTYIGNNKQEEVKE